MYSIVYTFCMDIQAPICTYLHLFALTFMHIYIYVYIYILTFSSCSMSMVPPASIVFFHSTETIQSDLIQIQNWPDITILRINSGIM